MSRFRELSYPIIFSKALVFSLIGIFLAFFLFRGETSLVSLFLTSLSLLWTAHNLFIEAVGYVLCSMSGFFLSKGVLKYEFSSGEFFIVLRSVLILFAASIGFIVLSAFLESNLTPRLIFVFLK